MRWGTLLPVVAILLGLATGRSYAAADDDVAARLAEAQKRLEEKKAAAAKAAAAQATAKPATVPTAAPTTEAELRAEVARLQAENAALRQQLAAAGIAPPAAPVKPAAAPAAGKAMTPAQVLAMIPANLRPVAGQRMNPIQEQRLDEWFEKNTKDLLVTFTGKFDANGPVTENIEGKAIDLVVTADKAQAMGIDWEIEPAVRVSAALADDLLTLKRGDAIVVTGKVAYGIRCSYYQTGTLSFQLRNATFARVNVKR